MQFQNPILFFEVPGTSLLPLEDDIKQSQESRIIGTDDRLGIKQIGPNGHEVGDIVLDTNLMPSHIRRAKIAVI